MKKTKFIHFGLFIIAVAFILVAHFYFSDYAKNVTNNIALFTILAISYNLINGVTGQFSLEPNGFVALGAYVGALLLLDADAKNFQYYLQDPSPFILSLHLNSFALVMLIGGICASLLALILSFPVFRVRGDYLAIVTLGFGFIIQLLAVNFPAITNGSLGLTDIYDIDSATGDKKHYSNLLYTGFIAIFAVILTINLVYSKFGRAMKAVRDDEDAALAMGVNTFATKTTAFCTSAFFEGVGGVLLVGALASVSPEQFTFMLTFQLLIIIVLGGLGSMSGAIIGAILVTGGMEWLRFLDESMNIFGHQIPALPGLRMVVFSVILILVMLFARNGIMGQKELLDIPEILKRRFGK